MTESSSITFYAYTLSKLKIPTFAILTFILLFPSSSIAQIAHSDNFNEKLINSEYWYSFNSEDATELSVQNGALIGTRSQGENPSPNEWQYAALETQIDINDVDQIDVDVGWNFPSMGIISMWGYTDDYDTSWFIRIYDPWASSNPAYHLRLFRSPGDYEEKITSFNHANGSAFAHFSVVFGGATTSLQIDGFDTYSLTENQEISTTYIRLYFKTNTEYYQSGSWVCFDNFQLNKEEMPPSDCIGEVISTENNSLITPSNRQRGTNIAFVTFPSLILIAILPVLIIRLTNIIKRSSYQDQ